jgi:seryl-tRNA synthetase
MDELQTTAPGAAEQTETPTEPTNETTNESTNESSVTPTQDTPDETLSLRTEIERLQGEIARLTELQNRRGQELDEFCTLFPNVSLSELPPEVRQQTESGVPLAAAYALYEKREALRRENSKKNAEHSWHSMKDGAGGEYYSPSEVRSMSQKEVHKNYKKIMESMKHWK